MNRHNRKVPTEIPEHLDGGRVAHYLTETEGAAFRVVLDSIGLDVMRTYQFWESIVQRILGDACLTSQGCPWDVELPYFDETIRVEVKFSSAFVGQFRTGPRRNYRWIDGNGGMGAGGAHVVVLIGYDSPVVHCWVAPAALLERAKAATITVPGTGAGGLKRGPLGHRRIPMDQLLPEVLRAYREQLDATDGWNFGTP